MYKRPSTIKGASMYITFGQWAKPAIQKYDGGFRICLGYVALGTMSIDIEAAIAVGGSACQELLDQRNAKKES